MHIKTFNGTSLMFWMITLIQRAGHLPIPLKSWKILMIIPRTGHLSILLKSLNIIMIIISWMAAGLLPIRLKSCRYVTTKRWNGKIQFLLMFYFSWLMKTLLIFKTSKILYFPTLKHLKDQSKQNKPHVFFLFCSLREVK